MENVAESLEETVRGLGRVTGGLGLFVVGFFDSSLLSLPEINDVLLVYFGAHFPEHAYYYATMTVLGSASGCSLLYGLARWKGHTILKRKVSADRIDTVFRLFRRYGAFTIIIPAVLPPPFPFKIFVLSSGVLGLPYPRFLLAVLVGRSIRYFGEAMLAVRYGEGAIAFLRANAIPVLAVVVGCILVALVMQVLVNRRRRRIQSSGSARAEGFEARPIEEP